MATHNVLGHIGEQIATQYLMEKGYTIRHRNWRCGHKDLDIVASIHNTLVVVEVKTRRNTIFCEPEEAVGLAKMRNIIHATDAYLRAYAIDENVRFDIITVIYDRHNAPQINHIIQAFDAQAF